MGKLNNTKDIFKYLDENRNGHKDILVKKFGKKDVDGLYLTGFLKQRFDKDFNEMYVTTNSFNKYADLHFHYDKNLTLTDQFMNLSNSLILSKFGLFKVFLLHCSVALPLAFIIISIMYYFVEK